MWLRCCRCVSFASQESSASTLISNAEHDLFGALLQSKIIDLNARLDIPDIADLNEPQEMSIPQFHTKHRMEVSLVD